MTDLIERIYNDILVYEKDTVEIDSKVSEKISQITERYSEKLTPDEQEKLKDILHEAVFSAEVAGIKVGIKFTFELLHSVFAD